jgi:hypothetical protein
MQVSKKKMELLSSESSGEQTTNNNFSRMFTSATPQRKHGGSGRNNSQIGAASTPFVGKTQSRVASSKRRVPATSTPVASPRVPDAINNSVVQCSDSNVAIQHCGALPVTVREAMGGEQTTSGRLARIERGVAVVAGDERVAVWRVALHGSGGGGSGEAEANELADASWASGVARAHALAVPVDGGGLVALDATEACYWPLCRSPSRFHRLALPASLSSPRSAAAHRSSLVVGTATGQLFLLDSSLF